MNLIFTAKLHAKTMGELQTPMHYAARNNAVESLKCLMKLGGKVSDRDYKDRTPLFLAAEQGKSLSVSYRKNANSLWFCHS